MTSCPDPRQIQRDLHWCLSCAPLAGQLPVPDTRVDAPMVARVQALWQARTSHRLGHYYEMLWQALLEQGPRFEVILTDHQLSSAGQTLGALDFLLWDNATDGYLHLEVAAKFYLQAGDAGDNFCWRGPNARDSLGRKLAHMQQHQLRLTQNPEAREQLNRLLAERQLPPLTGQLLRTALLMQGWRFTPLTHDTSAENVWAHWRALATLPAHWGDEALWLPKFSWLSGDWNPEMGCCADARRVVIRRARGERAPLVSVQGDNVPSGDRAALLAFPPPHGAVEGTPGRRLMLVPDQWPD